MRSQLNPKDPKDKLLIDSTEYLRLLIEGGPQKEGKGLGSIVNEAQNPRFNQDKNLRNAVVTLVTPPQYVPSVNKIKPYGPVAKWVLINLIHEIESNRLDSIEECQTFIFEKMRVLVQFIRDKNTPGGESKNLPEGFKGIRPIIENVFHFKECDSDENDDISVSWPERVLKDEKNPLASLDFRQYPGLKDNARKKLNDLLEKIKINPNDQYHLTLLIRKIKNYSTSHGLFKSKLSNAETEIILRSLPKLNKTEEDAKTSLKRR